MQRVVLAVVVIALAGCLSGMDPVARAPAAEAPAQLVSLEIATREGPATVQLYVWGDDLDTSTAVLAVGGMNGGAHLLWGPLWDTPGYAMSQRAVDAGFAFVATDLPGYQRSAGKGTESMDQWMHAIDQVAAALRDGALGRPYATVVGLGISMGGILVSSTQGLLGSFDAIIPAAVTLEGIRGEAAACLRGAGCPDRAAFLFHAENADPAVAAEMLETRHEFVAPPAGIVALFAWIGCPDCLADVPRPPGPTPWQLAAARVDVPVLAITAEHDFFFLADGAEDQSAWYPGSPDARTMFFASTGHGVFHHLNHDDVAGASLAFLSGLGSPSTP